MYRDGKMAFQKTGKFTYVADHHYESPEMMKKRVLNNFSVLIKVSEVILGVFLNR